MDNIFQQKNDLRYFIKKKREALSVQRVNELSAAVLSKLTSLPEIQSAKSIHTYVAWQNEVRTHDFIKFCLVNGRRIIVPAVNIETHTLSHYEIHNISELSTGAFGILEPDRNICKKAALDKIDTVIVPGLAFDRKGHRLGYGGGYYDKFLKDISATKIALGFEFQVVDEIPTTRDDEKIDVLVTEENTYRF